MGQARPRTHPRRARRRHRRPPLDLSQYERLIDDGLASADGQGCAVDHVTARRLAIWLAYQPQASRLMQYCVSRGDDLGPVGTNFASACDQVDRADLMLTGLRDRVRQGASPPEPAWPGTDGAQVLALAGRDTGNSTVSLILDTTTANIAMYAITAYAGDREAHVREVQQYGQNLPEGSYGRQNRQAIAARETRVAARLRAVEQAYRAAIDRDAIAMPKHAETLRAPERQLGREIDLEAEP